LHARLNSALTQSGRIVVTVPSPGKQESLRTSGQGLQIIDETITLQDLVRLAEDVRGTLTYFNMISVWDTNDYIHAVVEREADHVRVLSETDQMPIKGWPHRSLWARGRDFLYTKTGVGGLQERWRRAHIHRRLSKRIPG